LRIGCLHIAERTLCDVEIHAVRLDDDLSLSDIAFVRRRARPGQFHPAVVVPEAGAYDALRFQAVLLQLIPDFDHERRIGLYRVEHIVETKTASSLRGGKTQTE